MNKAKLPEVLQYAATKTKEYQRYEIFNTGEVYYVPDRRENFIIESITKFIMVRGNESLNVGIEFLLEAYAKERDVDYERVRQRALKAIESGSFEHNFLSHWLLLITSDDCLLALSVAFGRAFSRNSLISPNDVDEELNAIDYFVSEDLKAFFTKILGDIGVIECIEDGYALVVPERDLKALRPAEQVAYFEFTSVFWCKEALFPFKPLNEEEC